MGVGALVTPQRQPARLHQVVLRVFVYVCVCVCAYVCMYMWSHILQEYGSTEYGCPSCSWSAEQEKLLFPCPRSCLRIWSRQTVSAVPSCVSLLISILRLNMVLTYGVLPEFV